MLKRSIVDSTVGTATYIAAGTRVVGNISGKGAYIFCGQVEGECDIDGPITIAEGSHWNGAIRATDIIIAGSVEGNVTAKQRLQITGTAHITGSLCGSSIVVAEGAVIEGNVSIAQAKETQRPKISTNLSVSQAKS